jgi:hypothetical protein
MAADAPAAMVSAQDWASENRAMYILDPPWVADPKAMAQWLADTPILRDANTALYYPWVQGAGSESTPPGGVVAGIYVRTDNERGVWKAPAGAAADLRGVQSVGYSVSEQEQEILNPLGINAIGQFGSSPVVWGSRTLSSDPEWKYISVLRLGLLIEASIEQGTRWAVFEPNNEALWAGVSQAVETLLHDLWRDGALAGAGPQDAYFVRCGRETMTQDDIDEGRLIIEIGFAPLKPAEFVIIRIHQKTNTARSLPGRSLSRILRSIHGLAKDSPHQLLFAGPARSGKTLAAQGLAGQLGRPLLRVDLSQVMSAYIGETEKNLARLLDEAAARQTILFFDEADALFGKRTEVRSSNDRYTKPEGSSLVTLIETYPGLVVLGVEGVRDLSKKRQIVKFNRR